MLEILAPCGSEEGLDAALNSGADAVYLGMPFFSARRNAVNFTFEQLKSGVKKAHSQGVKVYVALNTLVFDDELADLKSAVEQIDKADADAVIVQDFGVALTVREMAPRLKLHASTQMTITSAKGAEFVKKMGFSRVVLPRELSLEEIREITSSVDIETEVFVHGALCVSLSGQCFLSALIGGRSGNRGLCAQPCRLNYRCGNRENVLSLKDLSLINELRSLEEAGVISAKIEGRMKRPEYTAGVIDGCKTALKGGVPDMELLKTVFSRSGFTKSYFDGTFNNMQGVRLKEDSENIPEALIRLRQLYKDPCKRFVIDIHVSVRKDMPILCTVCCGDFKKEIKGAVPQAAINRSITCDEIEERMSKLGGTVFSAGRITCETDDGLSVCASALNELRREAVSAVSRHIADSMKNEMER